MLNKKIWRHRRAVRRKEAQLKIQEAARSGSMPKSGKKSIVTNWKKLFGEADPSTALRKYFEDIYYVPEGLLEVDEEVKQRVIQTWNALRIDILPRRISVSALRKAIAKLKNGKGSPDGCSAEMFKHLPDRAFETLADYFSFVFADLSFPESWTVVLGTLIPKIAGATALSKFRAIACLPAARKLLGYLWLQFLPSLRFDSFQCGFVPGGQATYGVYTIKRAFELSREWGKPIYLAQLDLRKAFDRVRHSAIVDALKLQGVSLQCLAILCALLSKSQVAMRLGHISADPLKMYRGLPQGAPESPILFVLVTEFVLRPLIRKWNASGDGWRFDALYLDVICYADDVIIIGSSLEILERMLDDVISAFHTVGLEVSTEKCHWTSFPMQQGHQLRFGTDDISWEASLTFVGTILSPTGNDELAIQYRLAQATKAFFRWAPILQCSSASVRSRVELGKCSFVAALLWLCETWTPTRTQVKRLNSWAARMFSRVVRTKRRTEDNSVEHWRRLHRVGHVLLRAHGGCIDACRRRKLHSFAGHLARDHGSVGSIALRTRSMAWWRQFQSIGAFLHPHRFRVWRWEQQLVSFYGEAKSVFIDDDVGWMAKAQDRNEWKISCKKFMHTSSY